MRIESPGAREKVPRCRVLCVDDNRDSADLEAMLLKLYGFETKVCYDGESALKEVRQSKPDICIIDLNMPGMDGDELVKRLRAEMTEKSTVYVALTAMSSARATSRIEAAGFHAHLVKPVDPNRFIKEIERICGQIKV